MEFFIVFICIVVYVILSSLFVSYVKNKTHVKFYKWLAIAFVILLPTWDVILGTVVYLTACRFIPKVAIYETVETDGIYYEGMQDYLSEQKESNPEIGEYKLVATGWIDSGIKKGFKFIEFASDKKTEKYKCIKLDEDNKINKYATAICIEKNAVESKYTVKITKKKTGTAEMDFKNIYNRATGKLMAEYKQVVLWPSFPFFNWLHWGETGGSGVSCPTDYDRYFYFEYEVLKPKK